MTSQTVGPAGKTIGPLQLGSLRARLRVRKGTFPIPVQVTITVPYGRFADCRGPSLRDVHYPGYRAVGAVGILVQQDGWVYRTRFTKPFTLRLISRSIKPASIVVAWNGRRLYKVLSCRARVAAGGAGIPLRETPACSAAWRKRYHGRHPKLRALISGGLAFVKIDANAQLVVLTPITSTPESALNRALR